MELCKVVGIQTIDFFSEKDRRQIQMMKYHCMMLPSSPNFEGFSVNSFSVSFQSLGNWRASGFYVPVFGAVCQIVYNRYGRVEQFIEVAQSGDVFELPSLDDDVLKS